MYVRERENARQAKAKGRTVPENPRAPARVPATIERAYERFLALPVTFVLAVLWMVGAVLLGWSVLVLYLAVRVLVGFVAGL